MGHSRLCNVTELKKAETACRESENRLTLAIQQAGMGTWDVDLRTGEAIWSQTISSCWDMNEGPMAKPNGTCGKPETIRTISTK